MTRFARAKGSKSSNERVEEDATDWWEFKQQMEQKNNYHNDEVSTQNALKHIKSTSQTTQNEAVWADFGKPNGFTQNQEVSSKVSKKRKKDITSNLGENAQSEDNTSKLKKKKKKHDSSEDVSQTSLSDHISPFEGQTESPELKVKKKKSLSKSVENQSDRGVEGVDVTPPEKKSSKKEKRKKTSAEVDHVIDELPSMPSDCQISKEQSFQKKEQGPRKGKNELGDMSGNKGRKQQNFSGVDNASPHFKRRKPYVESSTISINGVTINVSKFDGFDVKTEDAQRLKELRINMLKEGIPKQEVDKVLKLERRKAEKALAREKKKVCFNCRKAGHLLSECPDIGSFETKNFESSAAVNLCYKCGSTEHTYYQCKVQKKDKYSFATCFICKEQGHISSQCPDNPKGLYPQGGSCKVCGEVTHLKKDCPKLAQKKSESIVTLDTLGSAGNLESLGEHVEVSKKPKTDEHAAKRQKVVKF